MSQPTLTGRTQTPAEGLRPWAIVEIADGFDENERTELIQAAYQLSRSGLVALALRGVTRQVVDRALDPVVDVRKDPQMRVVYIDADDIGDMKVAAEHASVVVARTEAFRAQLSRCGIEVDPARDWKRVLPELGELRSAAMAGGS